MLVLLYIEINAIGIIILLLLYFSGNRADRHSVDQVFFNRLLFSVMLMMVIDATMWLIDGIPSPQVHFFLRMLATLYFLLSPVIVIFWDRYCEYKTSDGKRFSRLRFFLYYLPLAVNTLLTLLSFSTGWFFSVRADNCYVRGPLYILHTALVGFYILHAAFLALRKARHTEDAAERREYNCLALFLIPPFFGATIQILHYGMATIWTGTAIGILTVYLYVQNRQISTDALTGINNRRQLGRYLRWKTSSIDLGMTLFVIMLDVDSFKAINDTYGHIVGDGALVEVANLLKQVCAGRNDFLARLGGDEFTVVCQRSDAVALRATITEIESAVTAFNRSGAMPYRLSLSIGFAAFDAEKETSIDAFLSCADRAMYCEKATRKRG